MVSRLGDDSDTKTSTSFCYEVLELSSLSEISLDLFLDVVIDVFERFCFLGI
jgi:hypothetical protein